MHHGHGLDVLFLLQLGLDRSGRNRLLRRKVEGHDLQAVTPGHGPQPLAEEAVGGNQDLLARSQQAAKGRIQGGAAWPSHDEEVVLRLENPFEAVNGLQIDFHPCIAIVGRNRRGHLAQHLIFHVHRAGNH